MPFIIEILRHSPVGPMWNRCLLKSHTKGSCPASMRVYVDVHVRERERGRLHNNQQQSNVTDFSKCQMSFHRLSQNETFFPQTHKALCVFPFLPDRICKRNSPCPHPATKNLVFSPHVNTWTFDLYNIYSQGKWFFFSAEDPVEHSSHSSMTPLCNLTLGSLNRCRDPNHICRLLYTMWKANRQRLHDERERHFEENQNATPTNN